MEFLADTTFLIDLWREQKKPGPARAFALQHASSPVGVPWVVAGEFMSGAVLAGHDEQRFETFLQEFIVIHSTNGIIEMYARLYAQAKSRRLDVGPNDLWIAGTAAFLGLPLITRNRGDFACFPEIQVAEYGRLA